MLILDGRIKDRSAIKTVIDVNKNFVGKTGYFGDCLHELSDLSKYYHGTITDVIESGETDFCFKYDYYGEPSDSMYFIADEDLLPAKEEYRPFTLEEFVNKFDVGNMVCFRRKIDTYGVGNFPPTAKALVTSIEYYQDEPLIHIGSMWYSLQRLFDQYELYDKTLGWTPFGVKTNG